MTKFTFISTPMPLRRFLLPTSFLLHRSTHPPITFLLLCKFYVLSLFGFIAQVTGNAAVQITPASFTSAIFNLTPGFTFLRAVIFRTSSRGGTAAASTTKPNAVTLPVEMLLANNAKWICTS